jgi:hypothetical protein
MITRFPVLEFLRSRQGAYASADGKHRLELVVCGYGFSLEATGETRRSRLSGVIGVAGDFLELHALVGLPNVICFRWSHEFRELAEAAEVEICLSSSELNASVILSFHQDQLHFGLVAGTEAKVLHELWRV